MLLFSWIDYLIIVLLHFGVADPSPEYSENQTGKDCRTDPGELFIEHLKT